MDVYQARDYLNIKRDASPLALFLSILGVLYNTPCIFHKYIFQESFSPDL